MDDEPANLIRQVLRVMKRIDRRLEANEPSRAEAERLDQLSMQALGAMNVLFSLVAGSATFLSLTLSEKHETNRWLVWAFFAFASSALLGLRMFLPITTRWERLRKRVIPSSPSSARRGARPIAVVGIVRDVIDSCIPFLNLLGITFLMLMVSGLRFRYILAIVATVVTWFYIF